MKKKNHPRPVPNDDAPPPAIICVICAKNIKKIQRSNSFILSIGKEQIKIQYCKLLHITVEGNYCYFHVQDSKASNEVNKYGIRKTLRSLKYLEAFGLAQVTPKRILNLAHVHRVLKNELFSLYLKEGIEVTPANRKRVAELLLLWSGLQLL